MGAPATLPAGFFDNQAPQSLPKGFFSRQPAPRSAAEAVAQGASPEELRRATGAPPTPKTELASAPSPTPPRAPDELENLGTDFYGGIKNLGLGAAKGALALGTSLSPLIHRIPYIGETLAPEQGILRARELAAPTGAMQKIGYGGEKAAEFLAPGGAEEKGATFLAEHAPALGRFAEPLARTAMSALSTGAVNKLQGGSFNTGATLGGGLGAVGEIGRATAPALAESALGVTKRLRGFGRTPGEAALDEVKGVRPGTVGANAQEKAAQLTTELERRAAASKGTASTEPALRVLDQEQAKALNQNDRTTYQMLHDIREQLTKEFSTGNPIPNNVSASRILDLKRGIGKLETTWNPEQRGGIKPVIRRVYSALDGELDRTVPGAKEINQRISSLIPVAQRGESAERGAGLTQRVAHRVAAHTGALAGALGGGLYAKEHGVTPGIGAAVGLLLPEMLASPSVEMAGARALRSGVLPRIMRGPATRILRKGNPNEE